jgi:hypothetical protein
VKILVRAKPSASAASPDTIQVRPTAIKVPWRPLRVLDFDIENRPLTYLGSDFTTAEVTAIAWAWTDRPSEVTVHLLGETELSAILQQFVAVYQQADMVTGHFIRGHDLPMVNGALLECGLPPLVDKLVQDTKQDLMTLKGVSKSQESLGAMFGLAEPKVQMNQARWRAANRLTPEGLALVRERVVGDVRQHMAMRARMLDLGILGPPRLWKSGAASVDVYTP